MDEINSLVITYGQKFIEKGKDLENSEIREQIWQQIMHESINHNRMQVDLPKGTESHATDWAGDLYEYFFQRELVLEGCILKPREKQKKQRIRGTIYTPLSIVHFIVSILRKCLLIAGTSVPSLDQPRTPLQSGERLQYRIADIACGTGRFLFEWKLQAESTQKIVTDNHVEQQEFDYSYYGFDIDTTALGLAAQSGVKGINWFEQDSLLGSHTEFNRGFDIIVGNPPYIESRAIPDKYWRDLKQEFPVAHKKFDISVVFIQQIFRLLHPGGWTGLITTNKWLVSEYGIQLRQFMLQNALIHYLFDVSELGIFEDAATYPIIIIFQKPPNSPKSQKINPELNIVQILKPKSLNDLYHTLIHFPNIGDTGNRNTQGNFLKNPQAIIATDLSSKVSTGIDEINFTELATESVFHLADANSPYELRDGFHTGNIRSKLLTDSPPPNDAAFKRAITSRQKVERYRIKWDSLWVHYSSDIIDRNAGEYGSLREPWIFEARPKILIKLFGLRLQAAVDHMGYYANNSLILLVRRPDTTKWRFDPAQFFNTPEEEFYYLMGVLNSRPITDAYRSLFSHTHVRGGYLQYYLKDLETIPLFCPTEANQHLMHEIATAAKNLEHIYSATLPIKKIEQANPAQELEIKIDHLILQLYRKND